ncbi:MAG TPA: 23S rRNA (uracil(1939)-C(5))-methyltransferase RlmD [Firmicutes bacterium]|nr:23S rRNA (uracil(1939)-C(5))-methyltransferase RlmD [Bacillota bacterium]
MRLTITDLNHRGEGVGREQGLAVFVPGAVPGDVVRVELSERKKSHARARLVDVIEPSPDRVAALCPVAAACGGCQLQFLSYPAQLRWKRQYLQETLRRVGGLSVEVAPTMGMEHPWGYRNKGQFPLGRQGGRVVAGCFAPGTHRIVPVEHCPLQHPAGNRVLAAGRSLLEEMHIPIYDEVADRGFARHLISRVAVHTGQSMGVLVTRQWTPPAPPASADWPGAFPRRWAEMAPGLASVYQNLNPRRTNIIMGPQDRLLWGRPAIEDQLLGLRFLISAHSFYQVNPYQAEAMYALVREWAALRGDEMVLDLYCGVGTIALVLAAAGQGRSPSVVGVEEVPQAVADARQNARLNGLDRVEFLCGRAEDILPSLLADRAPRVVVLDPPRQGVDARVLTALVGAASGTGGMSAPSRAAAGGGGACRLIYVSCHPATLARDLAILVQGGFHLERVQPVDMFPQTAHIETVASLRR